MKIYEEYIRRHQLANTSVFPHVQDGAILLRFKENGKYSWLVTTIRWNHEPQYHPGKYLIDTVRPVYNSSRRGFYQNVHDTEKVFWDQYHDHINHWIKNVDKSSVVSGAKEVALAVFEMFLHCNDLLVARSNVNEDQLYASIDPNKSIDDRYEAYLELRKTILRDNGNSSNGLAPNWKLEFDSKIIRNYMHWLADLVAK